MTDIKWQEPPAHGNSGRGRSSKRWQVVADALRARVGEWALVAEDVSSSTAGQIKGGTIAAFRPPHSFEAVTRKHEGGRHDIYARFVGEDGAA